MRGSGRCRAPPHARGGVPAFTAATVLGPYRPWGCSVVAGRAAQFGVVLPTPMGGFPSSTTPRACPSRPPYARGGVPVWHGGEPIRCLSSPRPWGCSRLWPGVGAAADVLPTPVGVFRLSARCTGAATGPPHACGGVPARPSASPEASESSPVGVFRSASPPTSGSPRPPHARGGVPLSRSRTCTATASSHVRGVFRPSPQRWQPRTRRSHARGVDASSGVSIARCVTFGLLPDVFEAGEVGLGHITWRGMADVKDGRV
jgi:hypothetical protein